MGERRKVVQVADKADPSAPRADEQGMVEFAHSFVPARPEALAQILQPRCVLSRPAGQQRRRLPDLRLARMAPRDGEKRCG